MGKCNYYRHDEEGATAQDCSACRKEAAKPTAEANDSRFPNSRRCVWCGGWIDIVNDRYQHIAEFGVSSQVKCADGLHDATAPDTKDARIAELGWINVSERNPYESQDILYVVEGGGEPYVRRGERNYVVNEGWWWCDENGEFDEQGNDGENSFVQWWMPTPVPPVRSALASEED